MDEEEDEGELEEDEEEDEEMEGGSEARSRSEELSRIGAVEGESDEAEGEQDEDEDEAEGEQAEAEDEAEQEQEQEEQEDEAEAEGEAEGDAEGDGEGGESEPDEVVEQEIIADANQPILEIQEPVANVPEVPPPPKEEVVEVVPPGQKGDIGFERLTVEVALRKLAQNANKNKILDGDNDDEIKEDEEQFNWEDIDFKSYYVENSGITFKQTPHVLCLCKLDQSGYSIVKKIYSSSLTDIKHFKFNSTPYFSSCGDFIGFYHSGIVVIYNAKTLEIKYKYKIEVLEETPDFEEIQKMYISAKCSYFVLKTKFGSYFFDCSNGKQFDGEGYQSEKFQSFINKTELIGTGFAAETGFSKIVTYDIKDKKVNDKSEFDKYYQSIMINDNGRGCIIEQDNALYYVDLYRKPKDLIKLIEGYDFSKIKNISKESVAIIYSEESKIYLALYKIGKLIFRRKIDMAIYNFPTSIH